MGLAQVDLLLDVCVRRELLGSRQVSDWMSHLLPKAALIAVDAGPPAATTKDEQLAVDTAAGRRLAGARVFRQLLAMPNIDINSEQAHHYVRCDINPTMWRKCGTALYNAALRACRWLVHELIARGAFCRGSLGVLVSLGWEREARIVYDRLVRSHDEHQRARSGRGLGAFFGTGELTGFLLGLVNTTPEALRGTTTAANERRALTRLVLQSYGSPATVKRVVQDTVRPLLLRKLGSRGECEAMIRRWTEPPTAAASNAGQPCQSAWKLVEKCN